MENLVSKLENDILELRCNCYNFCKEHNVLNCENCRVKESVVGTLAQELIERGWTKNEEDNH